MYNSIWAMAMKLIVTIGVRDDCGCINIYNRIWAMAMKPIVPIGVRNDCGCVNNYNGIWAMGHEAKVGGEYVCGLWTRVLISNVG